MIKALKRAHPFVIFTYFAGMDDSRADDLFISVVFLS